MKKLETANYKVFTVAHTNSIKNHGRPLVLYVCYVASSKLFYERYLFFEKNSNLIRYNSAYYSEIPIPTYINYRDYLMSDLDYLKNEFSDLIRINDILEGNVDFRYKNLKLDFKEVTYNPYVFIRILFNFGCHTDLLYMRNNTQFLGFRNTIEIAMRMYR